MLDGKCENQIKLRAEKFQGWNDKYDKYEYCLF